MPRLGLGTYTNNDKDSILTAIVEGGYRMIDTAEHYFNEEFVG